MTNRTRCVYEETALRVQRFSVYKQRWKIRLYFIESRARSQQAAQTRRAG